MKKRLTLVCLFLGISISLVGFQGTQSKRLRTFNDSDTVFVMQGSTEFHMYKCPRLKSGYTSTMYSLVVKRGYNPCPECCYIIETKSSPDPAVSIVRAGDKRGNFNEQVGFRGTSWGMDKQKVRAVEKAKFVKEDKGDGDFKGFSLLIFEDSIGSRGCLVVYYFADNQLTRGRYIITESHSNENLYIDDYNSIKKQISDKYGSPDVDDTFWKNDLYKNDPDEYGMAVSVGHLVFQSGWLFKETSIVLTLKGDNYKIALSIDYAGLGYDELEKKVRDKARNEIF